MRAIAALIFAIPSLAFADTRAMPPLTPDKLFGTWEAVMGLESGMGTGVYRIEIRKGADSYFIAVLAGSRSLKDARFISRMTSSQLHDGKLTLRFRIIDQVDPDREFTFEGSAVGEGQIGSLVGKLRSTGSRYYPDSSDEIWFKKGSWTRQFADASKEAEKYIDEQRHAK